MPDAIELAAQTAYIIEELHLRMIVHRDVKLENFIYDPETEKITVIDFGFAKRLQSLEDKLDNDCGTELYMAPEMHDHKDYTYDVDWYAYGCLTYQLFFYIPMQSQFCKHRKILKRIQSDGMNVIYKCTEPDSANRIKNLNELKLYPIFKDINWKKFERLNSIQNIPGARLLKDDVALN